MQIYRSESEQVEGERVENEQVEGERVENEQVEGERSNYLQPLQVYRSDGERMDYFQPLQVYPVGERADLNLSIAYHRRLRRL
jgi:hypothetical protein